MAKDKITLENIRSAQERVKPYIRQTPIFKCHNHRHPLKGNPDITFKLECQQVTGSFKVRGALNKLLSLPDAEKKRPLFAASGGNHGLAVAYAGHTHQLPTTIYLPVKTAPYKIEKIKDWGAEIVLRGLDIKEAIEAAEQDAHREKATYIHPFADSDVILGQGTLGVDIMEQLPTIDTLIVAIGGGGLIGGVSTAAKAINPQIKVIGVEPETYPTMTTSLAAGKVVPLPRQETVAVTLAVLETSPLNLDLARKNIDEIVLVSEEDIKIGTRWLWNEFFIAAEYSGAAALAAVIQGKISDLAGHRTCILICGAGYDGIDLPQE